MVDPFFLTKFLIKQIIELFKGSTSLHLYFEFCILCIFWINLFFFFSLFFIRGDTCFSYWGKWLNSASTVLRLIRHGNLTNVIIFDLEFTIHVKANVNFNPLNVNPTKWSNTLKQFVSNLPTNWLSVFEHFVNLAFKGLIQKKAKEIGIGYFF